MPVVLGRSFGRRELARRVGDWSQLFGVELLTHGDGRERGVRVLRFRTGSGLSFDLLVDRAMDLAGMEHRGVPVGWHSPTGFRSPWLHEADAEDGLGWLRSFSGLLATCGLDHIMAPAEESADHFHYRSRHRVVHGLHGRVAYEPARLTGYGERWEGDRCVLFARGEIRQAAMFAENLLLEREVEVEVGTDTLRLRDRVTNLGFDPTPHALLYHVNLGWPVVDEGTRLVAPIEATPFMVHDPATTDVGPLEQVGPRPAFREQVYEHRVRLDAAGTGRAALVNGTFATPAGEQGIALEIAYDGRAMPALFQWQNFQEGHYVVAMEPATLHGGSREDAKARGDLPFLAHGETRSYRLDLTPLAGAAVLGDLERRLRL